MSPQQEKGFPELQRGTESPLGSISCIRFRAALNLPNSNWIKPLVLQEDMQKQKQQAVLSKKPEKEQLEACLSTILRVEGMPHVQHEETCDIIMSRISDVTKLPFVQASSRTLGNLEWEIDYRSGGEFAQQIRVQLPNDDALSTLIMHVHGSGVRINEHNLALEVRSIHPKFSHAGALAKNIVPPPLGGGPCL